MTGIFLATSNTQLCMEPLNSPKTLAHKQKISDTYATMGGQRGTRQLFYKYL